MPAAPDDLPSNAPLPLTAEQVAQLRDSVSELACVGPEGEPAGHWVGAEQYRTLRRLAYEEAKRILDSPADLPRPDPSQAALLDTLVPAPTPSAMLEQVIARWGAGGAQGQGDGTNPGAGADPLRGAA